jgi:hypothetical protein
MVEHVNTPRSVLARKRGPADSGFAGPISALLRLPAPFFWAVKVKILRHHRIPCRG